MSSVTPPLSLKKSRPIMGLASVVERDAAIFLRVRRGCQPRDPTRSEEQSMCRNIRTLFNFEPPATEEEIRAYALQFVRKLSGFAHPSKVNEAAFSRAVDEVSDAARRLLDSLETASTPRNREVEAMKAKARARERFA